MGRNGSRGKGKVDSASSLEQSADVAPAQPASSASMAAVQDQLAKVALSE